MMDRKEAADLLDNLIGMVEDNHGADYDTALKMGIEALSTSGDGPEPVDDTISRRAAIDAAIEAINEWGGGWDAEREARDAINALPSAQPEVIRCKDCIYYDPPHVENNGVRYEYDEMPADAFDALGTGLVNAEYGINIGGRCCVDYYCKNYSDDKRVFVREDNYCGRAERRTDNANIDT